MNAVISQFDLVTAYGWGLDALWDGLMSNQTAIRPIDRFNGRNFVSDQAALVPDLNPPAGGSRTMAMLERLLGRLVGQLDPSTPLILATTVGEIEFIELAVLNDNADLASRAAPSALLRRIKSLLGLTSPAMVISSACASSSAALAQAASIIQRGDAPSVLLVTCDCVSEFVYSGFSTLQSLCESPAKPFDAHRCGLSLGEAAAWALVTDGTSAPIDDDSVSVLGWASTTDAIHMTAPDRNAAGLSRAISRALGMAGCDPSQIAFIAAHGTATVYSDAMELLAFGGAMPGPLPIFSVKGGTGHTLGAAGLIQILVSARSLARQEVPPTVGFSQSDPDALGWVHQSPTPIRDDSIALSTNSGFGGVNTAILLGRNASPPSRPKTPTPPEPSVQAITWSLGNESNDSITALVGKPIKYLSRMTAETRCCLAAAARALGQLNVSADAEIGILAGGEEGLLRADTAYFHDYIAAGRSLARGNLFIYTLPTSAVSEVAIALNLRGPTLHFQSDQVPAQSLVEQARRMIRNCEADAILALWSSPAAAVCFAIDSHTASPLIGNGFDWNLDPLSMAQFLAASEKQP